ncbi:MAG: HEAT repeat domain-containing protein [Planctomycetota bacterium]
MRSGHLLALCLSVSTVQAQEADPLLSSDSKIRTSAMQELAKSQDIPKYREMLKDENFLLRKAAVFALARQNTTDASPEQRKSAVEALEAALQDSVFSIRFEAARTLGNWNIATGEAVLVEALLDTNPLRRRQAAEALFHVGTSLSIKNLVYNLRDADFTVRRACIDALCKITGQNFNFEATKAEYIPLEEGKRRALIDDRKNTLQEFNSKKSDLKPAESKLLRMDMLGKISMAFKDALGAHVSEYSSRNDASIAQWQQWWLDNKDADRIAWLTSGLKHENPATRRISVLSLGDIGAVGSHDAIVEKLQDADSDVVVAACRSLGKLGKKESIPHLLTLLKSTAGVERTDASKLNRNFAAYQALLDLTQADYNSTPSTWEEWWERSKDFFSVGQDLPKGVYNVRLKSVSGSSAELEVKLFYKAKQQWFTNTYTVKEGEEVGADGVEHSYEINGRTYKRNFSMKPGLKVTRIGSGSVTLAREKQESTLRLP